MLGGRQTIFSTSYFQFKKKFDFLFVYVIIFCDYFLCLPSLHRGKWRKLSWKSHGILLSDFFGNPTTHSSTLSFKYLLIHPRTLTQTHLFIHLPTHSLIYLLIHPPAHTQLTLQTHSLHRCQPSHNRAGNPAFRLSSRIFLKTSRIFSCVLLKSRQFSAPRRYFVDRSCVKTPKMRSSNVFDTWRPKR